MMKTILRVLTFGVVPLVITGQQSPASGASQRAAYLDAYRVWREADPNLEHDLNTASRSDLISRTQRAGEAAAKYAAARRAYLDALVADARKTVAGLESASINPKLDQFTTAATAQREFLAGQSASLAKLIDAYSRDTDRGIVRLRQDLDKEKAALEAIPPILTDEVKSMTELGDMEKRAETSRKNLAAKFQEIQAGLQASADDAAHEAEAWNTYYAKLSDAVEHPAATPAAEARIESAPAGPPVSSPPAPADPTRPEPIRQPTSSAAADTDRYLGGWTYPTANPVFFGEEPEFVDLIVREENGVVTGSLYARFKTPPGSTRNPVLRFDFSGKPSNTKTQTFDLVTSDGGKGTIELIPGPAVNLLEVNFHSAPRPDKVYQGDVIVVKK